MIGGLPNSKTDGSFCQGLGVFFKEMSESDKLYREDLYDRIFNVNNWVGHTRGEFGST